MKKFLALILALCFLFNAKQIVTFFHWHDHHHEQSDEGHHSSPLSETSPLGVRDYDENHDMMHFFDLFYQSILHVPLMIFLVIMLFTFALYSHHSRVFPIYSFPYDFLRPPKKIL